MDWLTVLGMGAGVAMLMYASRSKTIAKHPSQRGMFVGTGLALLGCAAWIAFQRTAPQFDADKLFTAALIILSVPLYVVMIGAPFARKKGGAVLHDVRRPRSRRYSGYATAALFCFLAVVTVIQTGLNGNTIAQMAFYISVVLYFASPLFGKVELRQEGIVDSYSLLRWKDIVSHQWMGEDECDLILTTKSLWRKNATIVFAPDDKETVELILKEHL